VLLAMVTIRSFRGHYSSGGYLGMEVPGIYWHFVDVMWIVVFFGVHII
jgi:cytochrome c oxidase subunit 3